MEGISEGDGHLVGRECDNGFEELAGVVLSFDFLDRLYACRIFYFLWKGAPYFPIELL